jgi:Virulence-associated protein E
LASSRTSGRTTITSDRVRETITNRSKRLIDELGVDCARKIAVQETPGTLEFDPDDAEAVRSIIASQGLEDELRVANETLAAEAAFKFESENGYLSLRGHIKQAQRNDLHKLAGDMMPDKTGADRWDPHSIKNVAIFLGTNGVTPWHNNFDHKDYLEACDKSSNRLTDAAALNLKMQMHSTGLRVSTDFCHETLSWIAQRNSRHPVKDYLAKHQWDGKPRLDNLLPHYFGTEETIYHQSIGRMFMIAAVRRVRNPGCKFDTMLVLEGPQGARKSTSIRILAGDDWFTDGMAVGTGAKETIEQTCGKWIIETAELAGISRRGVQEVKQSLSKQSDNARLAYGRLATEVPRQFVMCGTTNDAQFLKDKTGNRRFWCASVGAIDTDALEQDRNQLWAEAAAREKAGDCIYLQDRAYDMAMAEQARRVEDDPLDIALDEALGDVKTGSVKKSEVYHAVGCSNPAQAMGSLGARVAAWMARNGWEDSRTSGGKRERCFNKGSSPKPMIYESETKTFHTAQ